jgi:hypothetical protein
MPISFTSGIRFALWQAMVIPVGVSPRTRRILVARQSRVSRLGVPQSERAK